MASRREIRRRSKSRPPAFDFLPRSDSLCTSTRLLRPMPQAAPPATGFAVRRSSVARVQKKNLSRRRIFPAACPCWGDSGWADLSRAPRVRRSPAPVGLRAWSRSPRREAAAVPARSLSLLGPAAGPLIVGSTLARPPPAELRARCHTFRKNGNYPGCSHRTSGRSRWFSERPLLQFNLCQRCHSVRPFILECKRPVSAHAESLQSQAHTRRETFRGQTRAPALPPQLGHHPRAVRCRQSLGDAWPDQSER